MARVSMGEVMAPGSVLATVGLVICLGGCGGRAPEAEEPVEVREGAGQEVVQEREMSLDEALAIKDGEIQECLGKHAAWYPEVGELYARIDVSDCGRVLRVETVVGDEDVDECLMEVLEVVQLERGPSCRDEMVNKTYTVVVDLLEER
jgi:hypothetical protein